MTQLVGDDPILSVLLEFIRYYHNTITTMKTCFPYRCRLWSKATAYTTHQNNKKQILHL